MLRCVPLLVLLVGCDQVLGLERDVPPPVCGPFEEPTLVPIHEELVDAKDFSVDSSGTRGMIYAMFPRASTRLTGVHPIKLVNGMWRGDATRDVGAITALDGGHIAENDSMVGWLLEEGLDRPEVREYTFSTAWDQSTTGIVDPLQSQTSTAGNVIVLPFGGVGTIRFMVTILLAERAGDLNTMRIFQRISSSSSWELTPQADPLKTSRAKINPSAGVMTADHGKLVYAATVGSNTTSRLYASARIKDEFAPGSELIIDGIESDADLTEPWINADCSALYFGRDGKSWMALAVDDPASEP